MDPEKDIYHVVIRLPFKRPDQFIEPPSIVWTEEMEHKLWQYMSQKNTDWNVIAEQLGVPTSFIVRHAAFIYETQLRGIHQQLRQKGASASVNRTNTKSPIPSKSRPTSIRYSNSLQQQSEQISSNNISQETITQKTLLDNRSNNSSRIALNDEKLDRSSLNNSLYKSNSSSQPHPTAYLNDNSTEEESDSITNNETSTPSSPLEEEVFSNHFQRMRLQVEEPAFLPHNSYISNNSSLISSRQQLSLSIQNLKKYNTLDDNLSSSSIHSKKGNYTAPNTQPQSPVIAITTSHHRTTTAPSSSSNESALNSIGSSFSDLSDSSVTQSALEEAFLSKFNHGSKMSLLNFSHKYKE
ncbi:uncharacterized protein BX663DRAFT_552032 [Cokeromyces recurvatus]|uniref:uncharacterized protein n=1 Tax=Cokeromyces recurvatus TaxID=90255 RepID=UPI002221070C|nr:uncharacterized protein BX663DRAFT_552032 [Cokeromyces recurvatus]KAI7902623.1 hypothetical protein BX663DRAFT_552032 [Cokeromyces recurvatus]